MARLRAQGVLVLKRQGARGRVNRYGVNLARMLQDTRPARPRIGDGFAARLDPAGPAGKGGPLRAVPAAVANGWVWAVAQPVLHAEDAARFPALTDAEMDFEALTFVAPTRFLAACGTTNLKVRLLTALRRADPAVRGDGPRMTAIGIGTA
jgi:hypothetical protein